MRTRATRMKMKTTRMKRTRIITRGEDNKDKEDEDDGQQGGRRTTTRTQDKDVDNVGQKD